VGAHFLDVVVSVSSTARTIRASARLASALRGPSVFIRWRVY